MEPVLRGCIVREVENHWLEDFRFAYWIFIVGQCLFLL